MRADVIKRSEEMRGKINPRYDMGCMEVRAMMDHYTDRMDLTVAAFSYGYYQGQKAERNVIPVENPRKVGELREAITYTANQTKNKLVLKDVLQIADLFRRQMDEDEYKTLSDADWKRVSSIRCLLQCEDKEKMDIIQHFIMRMCEKDTKQSRKVG